MKKIIFSVWSVGFILLGLTTIADATLINIGEDLAYDSNNSIVWLSDRSVFQNSPCFYDSISIMNSPQNSGTFVNQINIGNNMFKLSWRTATFSEMLSLNFGDPTTREIFTPDHERVSEEWGFSWNVYCITGAFSDPVISGPCIDVPFYSMEAFIDRQNPNHILLNPDEMDFGIQDTTLACTARLFAVADLQPVPEPATILLMGLCLPVLIGIRRWRYRS